jgi:hypothetical protein
MDHPRLSNKLLDKNDSAHTLHSNLLIATSYMHACRKMVANLISITSTG